jgi:hypothetical protein
LPGSAVRQDLEHNGQIGQAWNDLFHAHHGHVHAWHGRRQTPVALIGDQHDGTSLSDGEVGPGDAHVSTQELLA